MTCIVLGWCVMIACPLFAKPPKLAPRSRITVVVCDLAGVTVPVQLEARNEVIRILARARVDIDWIEAKRVPDPIWPPRCVPQSLQSYFSIIIAPRKSDFSTDGPDTLGTAPVKTGPYRLAYVFWDRVENFAKFCKESGGPSSIGMILADAIAHELGHLISGPSHSLLGIMLSAWGYRQCEDSVAGRMIFDRPLAK
jgi:hypothetical protein